MKTVLLFCLLLLVGLSATNAQVMPIDTTTNKNYYILLKDGSHIHGRIIRRDSTMMTVRMKSGQLTYVEKELFSQITSFQPVVADSAAYFTEVKTSRPSQTTLSPGQYVVTLTDGTTLNGQVLSQDSSRVVLKTNTIGTVYVPAERVVRMERTGQADRYANLKAVRSIAYSNIFPQYLNFTPTAYQAEKGKAYYRNSFVYINQIDVGVTNFWSIGAGVGIVPLVTFGWISTKVSVPVGDWARVGVQAQLYTGSFGLSVLGRWNTSYIQGMLSLGEPQNNVTLGLGFSGSANSSGQLLTVGIVRKVRPNLTFISENNIVLAGRGSGSSLIKIGGGVRFDRNRHSFDVSGNLLLEFGNYIDRLIFLPIPSASYQVRIGK